MKKILIIALALVAPAFASAATLSVSPTSQSLNVGDTLTVTVGLNTQGSPVDGVDVRYLDFNPLILQVVDANSSIAGTQIAAGSLMPSTLSNSVDNTLGRIDFSQVESAGGAKYNGSGTLATVTFRAIAGGNVNLSFDYTSGKTTDSNIAANGSDILNAVINGSYMVSGPAAQGVPPAAGGAGNTGIITPAVPQMPVGNTNAPCVAANFAPLPSIASLTIGTRSSAVTTVQTFLVSKGYLPSDDITGYYGPLTQAAAAKYMSASSCGGASSTAGAYTFTRSLTIGATGADVKALQVYLNAKGYTVSTSGAGSPGQETTYFGPATQRAVIRFQIANGITPAVGFFGPVTRGYVK